MQTEILSGELLRDLSFEDYQGAEGVNASLLKVAHNYSMAHVKAILDGHAQEETEELSFGRAFHALLLEGKREWVVPPKTYESTKDGTKPWNWNANTCKAWREEQTKPILAESTVKTIEEMVCRIHDIGYTPKMGDTELTVLAIKYNIKLKARIDLLQDDRVVDFKTVTSAKPEDFVKHAYRYGYFLQAAFYIDMLKLAGVERSEFRLVAVEKEYPYATCDLKLVDDPTELSLLGLGRKQYRAALAKIAHAKQTNSWPAYGEVEAETVAPIWMGKEIDQLA